jgi:heat shock protein HtpX
MNTFKTIMLMVFLSVILVGIGGVVGGRSGMTIALVMAFGINFASYWFSDKMVLSMYGAKQVTESEEPELFGIVRRLTTKAQLPMPRVYIIDEDQPNAFATGRNPEHSAIACTAGIMSILSREELEGVLAHELAHVKHRDILIGTIAASIAGAITYLSHMAFFFGGGRHDDDSPSPIAMIAMIIVGPIAAMLVQMAISRSREFSADEGGAEICGHPRYLARALRKLDMASKQIPMDANPSTAHMFIVSPLFGGGISRLFSTHPPMEERIARLEAMSGGKI